ncbi:MAG: hypothetical protein RLZ25_1220 [Pseudomonadota bacterium]
MSPLRIQLYNVTEAVGLYLALPSSVGVLKSYTNGTRENTSRSIYASLRAHRTIKAMSQSLALLNKSADQQQNPFFWHIGSTSGGVVAAGALLSLGVLPRPLREVLPLVSNPQARIFQQLSCLSNCPHRAFPLAVRVVGLPKSACVAFVIFIYTNYRKG